MENQNKFKKLGFNDWKVLILFYKSADWRYISYTINDVMNKTKLNEIQARYYLKKLEKLELIKSYNSCKNFYTPILDENLRELIEENYFKAISILGLVRFEEATEYE